MWDKEAQRQASLRYYHTPNGKKKRRDWHFKRKYGITGAQFDAMITAQGGLCAACGRAFGSAHGDRPVVDHDHGTGKIRGVAHRSCNSAIGHLGDTVDALRKVVAYLERAL